MVPPTCCIRLLTLGTPTLSPSSHVTHDGSTTLTVPIGGDFNTVRAIHGGSVHPPRAKRSRRSTGAPLKGGHGVQPLHRLSRPDPDHPTWHFDDGILTS